MSEEEKKAIEMLNKYIAEHKFFNIRQADNLEGNIEISINLIEKQQKKIQNLQTINKEHLKLNGELREEIDELKKYEKYYEEMEEVNKKFISVDKIREKIKDLEDNMILFTNDKEKFNRYKYARDILEKLLEEK